MNTNRYESPKTRAFKYQPKVPGVGPAWWGLATAAAVAFAFAIGWLLTRSA